MDNYIRYTFYDELNKRIAIIYPNTPNEEMEQLQQEYDEVKFEE